MKIRTALKKSLNQIKTDDGKPINAYPFNSIVFPYVLRAFALILSADAALRYGVAEDDEVLKKIQSGLQNDILSLNNIGQWLQLTGFLNWWLEQENTIIMNDEGDNWEECWYESKTIIAQWNEYAKRENGG